MPKLPHIYKVSKENCEGFDH